MSNVLSTRLSKLEKQTCSGDPYALLSDEALEARIKEVADRIEAQVGMSISEYAVAISQALQSGEALPDGWTEAEARAFVASIPKAPEAGGSHAR